MNDLTPNERAILQKIVPDLRLGHKTPCAGPLGVFRLKLSEKLIWGHAVGYRMEVLRLGVNRSRRSVEESLFLSVYDGREDKFSGSTHEKIEENMTCGGRV